MAEKKDEKDTRSSRTKMIEGIPTQNMMTRGAATLSRFADKLGFTQEEKYKDKKYGEQKKAKGGVIKAKEGKWIQSAIKKPGALREQLGVKGKKPIPAKMLDRATKAPGKLGQRARLAKTLKGMK